MFSDTPFKIALFISIMTHSVAFFSSPLNLSKLSIQKAISQIEVTYYKTQPSKAQAVAGSLLPSESIPFKQKIEFKEVLDSADKAEIKKDLLSKTKQRLVEEKSAIRADVVFKDDFLQDIEISKRVEYLNYYQIIHEAIRRCACRNYSRGFIQGEVCVSFSLFPNGKLKEIKIIDEKSTTINFLKDIALRSIRDASPFPPLPKNISSSKFSFNVIISFELEK